MFEWVSNGPRLIVWSATLTLLSTFPLVKFDIVVTCRACKTFDLSVSPMVHFRI